MNAGELAAMLESGEDSHVEFKRDDVRPEDFAKELTAFLNLDGGAVLLGVEDDGSISGTSRPDLEEWVATLCRAKIVPPVVPLMSWVRRAAPDRDVLAVRVAAGPDKPYARVHNDRSTYFIRVGSTTREASREELERMFQASGRLHYGLKPVPGASFEALDQRRLTDCLVRVQRGAAPDSGDIRGWEQLLINVEWMTESAGQRVATVDGVLLFGKSPKQFLPQSGIRAITYPGTSRDYATRADEELRGPMVSLTSAGGDVLEPGLIERALDFVRRNTTPTARLQDGRRIDRPAYPEAVIREAVVNALVHRDYTIAGTDVLLEIFADRIEITSPGRLPNTVTVEGMRAGMRYARNQTLVNVMRDYGYVESRGMGVRQKIIPGMRAHNGTDADLIAGDHQFIVRLHGDPPG